MYHYVKQAWKQPDTATLRERMVAWRRENAFTVVEKPLRLDRARALGYKAKKGFVVVRVRIPRGGRTRKRHGVKGRKTRKMTNRKTLKMSYQWVAEIRAARKYKNLEVLNSYWVGKDGQHYFYEVIMIDPMRPEIKNDRTLTWITERTNRKRAERGLTSAAKKSRGLRSRAPSTKARPSQRANNRRGK